MPTLWMSPSTTFAYRGESYVRKVTSVSVAFDTVEHSADVLRLSMTFACDETSCAPSRSKSNC